MDEETSSATVAVRELLSDLQGGQSLESKEFGCAIHGLCGNVAKVTDPDLIQHLNQVIHELVCKWSPELLSECSGRNVESTLSVLDDMWRLLFSVHERCPVAANMKLCDEELKSLLALLSHKPEQDFTKIQVLVLRRGMEWLHQCIQCSNEDKVDRQSLLHVLSPYLSYSAEKVLRVQALIVLITFIKQLLAASSYDLLILDHQDCEYLNVQLQCSDDFSTLQILQLLSSLSCLSDNVKVMKASQLLASLADCDGSKEEEDIAAQLIQCIFDFEESTEEDVQKDFDSRHKESEQPHVKEAKSVMLKFGSKSSSNPLTFNVNSLEELVFMTGYEIAVSVGEAENLDPSLTPEQRSVRIRSALVALLQVIAQAGSVGVQRIMSVPYCLDAFCMFMRQHWVHLPTGKEVCAFPLCAELVGLIGRLVMSLTDVSQLAQETIVQWGLMMRLTSCLDVLRREISCKEVESRVTHSLFILNNCAMEAKRHHVFSNYADVILKALIPLLKSPDSCLSFNAKVVALQLGSYIDETNIHHLSLSTDQVELLVSNLKTATRNGDSVLDIYGGSCSVIECITWLESAAVVESNVRLMIHYGILSIFPAILKVSNSDIAVRAGKLLWSLTCYSDVRKEVQQSSEIISFLKTCKDEIFKLVLQSVQSADLDASNLSVYASGCYKHCKYEECLLTCDKLLEDGDFEHTSTQSLRVLQCKALFKVYEQENLQLKNFLHSLSKDAIHKQKSSSLDKLHQIVRFLGAAHDEGTIDCEGSKYLDMAMINLVMENELKKLNRCTLCVKNGVELKRSHIVPRSILDIFRRGFVQHQGNKGLTIAGGPDVLMYHTDKTITKYMLCGSCEHMLNVCGEQDFLKSFFLKIYDPSRPECLSAAEEIRYGKWLYHFCIGLLFRAIAGFIGIPDVMNNNEVYSLFVKCRKFLLNEFSNESLPSIYLLVNPAKVPREYQGEWVSEALVEPAFFHCPRVRLSNGSNCDFPEVHFMLVHVGILNMVVAFEPAKDVPMPGKYIVDAQSGVYEVPPEERRLAYMPAGVKTSFTHISENIKEDMKAFLFRRQKPFPKVSSESVKGNTQLQDVVGLVQAINSDFSALFEQYGGNFNFLPDNFRIDHETKMFELPSGYNLMIHSTTVVEKLKIKVSYFIGVTDGHQPFVIIYQCSNAGVKCFGCLVSKDDLTFQKYVSKLPLEKYLSIAGELEGLTRDLGVILPIFLRTKGYKNMETLLHFYKHRKDELKTLDTRCPLGHGCWYCETACANCMAPSAVGLTTVTEDRLHLQFCSSKCAEYYVGRDVPLQVSALLKNPQSLPPSSCSEGQHRTIFSIDAFARGSNKGVRFSLNVSQFLPEGVHQSQGEPMQYCCHYQVRQLFTQEFRDFLLSKEGIPVRQLRYSDSDAFTPGSSYCNVEQYFLEAIKLLFVCREKFMNMEYQEKCMPVFLDCSNKMLSSTQGKDSSSLSLNIKQFIDSLNSFILVCKCDLEWSMKQHVLMIHHIDSVDITELVEKYEEVVRLVIQLLCETIPALSTAADSDKPLRCTLILSAWKLATDLLGKYPLLIEKVKYELRDMWRRLLEFLSLIKNVQEVSIQASVSKVVHQFIQAEFSRDVVNASEFFYSLKAYLESDNLRWQSLIALYHLLPRISRSQKQLIHLTQSDMSHLVPYLKNHHTVHDALQFLSQSVTISHNIPLLIENNIPDILAELLDEEDVSEDDKGEIVVLVETIVTADTCEEEPTTESNELLFSFVELLEDFQVATMEVQSTWKFLLKQINARELTLDQLQSYLLLDKLLILIKQQSQKEVKMEQLCSLSQLLKLLYEYVEVEPAMCQRWPEITEVIDMVCQLPVREMPQICLQALFIKALVAHCNALQGVAVTPVTTPGLIVDLTAEDISVLLSNHFSVHQTLTFVEHVSFSSENCRKLRDHHIMEYLSKLHKEGNYQERIDILMMKLSLDP